MTAHPQERVESLVREARDAAVVVLARDDSTAEASRFLVGAVVALTDVLDAHRPAMASGGRRACPACGTAVPCPTVHRFAAALASHGTRLGAPPDRGAVALASHGARRSAPLDRGDAWARADAHFNGSSSSGPRRLVSLTDLGAFYVARGVRVTLPEPSRSRYPTRSQCCSLTRRVGGRVDGPCFRTPT